MVPCDLVEDVILKDDKVFMFISRDQSLSSRLFILNSSPRNRRSFRLDCSIIEFRL